MDFRNEITESDITPLTAKEIKKVTTTLNAYKAYLSPSFYEILAKKFDDYLEALAVKDPTNPQKLKLIIASSSVIDVLKEATKSLKTNGDYANDKMAKGYKDVNSIISGLSKKLGY